MALLPPRPPSPHAPPPPLTSIPFCPREGGGTLEHPLSTFLLEKSSLNQAISCIESLCRGVSPSQSKLLQNVIEILKNQYDIDEEKLV